MRFVWLLPLVLAACGGLEVQRPAGTSVPDDLRDAPAAQAWPRTPGSALYARLLSEEPEQAASLALELSYAERESLGQHIVATKAREDFWSARYVLDSRLPAHESAFICWYLGGFTSYATLGSP